MNYRSKALRDSAKGQSCALCGSTKGVVSAHCNDIEFRGMKLKAPDCLTAWLCQTDHDLCDGRTGKLTKEEKRVMWNRAFKRTVVRWFEQGIVKVS